MLRWSLLVLVIAACGGGSSENRDGGPRDDGGPGALDAGVEARECPDTQPTVIDVPAGAVVDGAHFYHVTGTVLSRTLVAGGSAEKIADLPGSPSGPIVVGDDVVFFVAGQMAWRVAKTGGGVPESLATVEGQLVKLATDGRALYFATITNTDILLQRAETPGGGSTLLARATEDGVSNIASDGVHVYWTPFMGGIVRRIAMTGGDPEIVADSAIGMAANTSSFGLALVGDEIVWSATYQSFSDGRLFAAPKAPGGARRVLSRTGLLTGLRVIGEDVYVMITGNTESAIAKIAISGTTPRSIIGCVPDRVLAVDASEVGVYVTSDRMTLAFPR